MPAVRSSIVNHQGIELVNEVAFLQILFSKICIYCLNLLQKLFFAQLFVRLLWRIIKVSFDRYLLNSLHFIVSSFGNLISRFILLRELFHFICLFCLLRLVSVFKAIFHHLFHYYVVILATLTSIWILKVKRPSLN